MKSHILKLTAVLVLATSIISCEKDTVLSSNALSGLIKLQEGYAPGAAAKVQIWGLKNYFMGYNRLSVVVLDSINPSDTIRNAEVRFLPMMTMISGVSTMKHNCPVEQPQPAITNGVLRGAIAFVMPTGTGGSWNLDVSVLNNKNNKSGTAKFDISVDNPTTSMMKVFTSASSDSTRLVLSMVEPVKPKVGINDIEFTLHRKASMMSWPADSTYTMVITPEMPSMGHGSPNNVNPVHTGNGHYKGKVNFTMTGEWRINVDVQKNAQTISNNTYFIISF